MILNSVALATSFLAYSQDQADVGADVMIRSTLTVEVLQGINFGTLTFTSSTPGGGMAIGPSGTIGWNPSGYTLGGSPSLGVLKITSPSPGGDISIACTARAKLAREGDNDLNARINLTEARYIMNNSGSTIICGSESDIGRPPYQFSTTGGVHTLSIRAVIYLKSGSIAQPGLFSTSNMHGEPLNFTISYI
tara:strand:- start:4228 stop:4803 length:576 start_codon:yes stop_codon:yes gene_type:complete